MKQLQNRHLHEKRTLILFSRRAFVCLRFRNVNRLFNTPKVGLEPTTNRLTADCSTTELLRKDFLTYSIRMDNYQSVYTFIFIL